MTDSILIVSNRLPVTVTIGEDGEPVLSRSSGGLVSISSGLNSLASEVLWIGWPGVIKPDNEATRAKVRAALARCHFRPVFLTADLSEKFYEGFSNGVLWPCLHTLSGSETPAFQQSPSGSLFSSYVEATRLFADEVVAGFSGPSTAIWVHDYQLFLLPGELRPRLGPAATIAFFLHVPFPPVEVIRSLPENAQIVDSLLSADLVGFHIEEYAEAFLGAAQRVRGYPAKLGQVLVPPSEPGCHGHLMTAAAFPLGIDFGRFQTASARPWTVHVSEVVREVRGRISMDGKVVLALSRLDLTKGIPQSLLAFAELLREQPELRGRVLLVLVVIPSRERCERYVKLRHEIEELVGRINGAFSTLSWSPVLFLYRSLSWDETVGLYSGSDVGLVAPLRDGMNLVAKEFVACHSRSTGVLVLSCMAGCAKELIEAVVVNPADVGELAAGLRRALEMPEDEQIARNWAMAKRLRRDDVGTWAKRFMGKLAEVKIEQQAHAVRLVTPHSLKEIAGAFGHSRSRLLCLDYDGSLVPFTQRPEDAKPDAEVLELLGRMAGLPRTKVMVLSGRDRRTLLKWLGGLPIEIAAEHGAWILSEAIGGSRTWLASTLQDGVAGAPWKREVAAVFREAGAVLPGAIVEEKTASVAFHFRQARALSVGNDVKPAIEDRIRSLRATLAQLTTGQPCRVVDAKECLEVRAAGVNKGALLRSVIDPPSGTPDFVLVVGDDETDEDAFAGVQSLGISAVTVRVGCVLSKARWNVPDVQAVRDLLRFLLAVGEAEKVEQ